MDSATGINPDLWTLKDKTFPLQFKAQPPENPFGHQNLSINITEQRAVLISAPRSVTITFTFSIPTPKVTANIKQGFLAWPGVTKVYSSPLQPDVNYTTRTNPKMSQKDPEFYLTLGIFTQPLTMSSPILSLLDFIFFLSQNVDHNRDYLISPFKGFHKVFLDYTFI